MDLPVRGDIRIGRMERGKVHPRLNGYTNIIVCSVNSNWGQLSPMKLGPFTVTEELNPMFLGGVCPGFTVVTNSVMDGVKAVTKQTAVCQNFENYWQYSKVYSVDSDGGNLGFTFYNRRAEGFAATKAKRRVFPKKSGVTTICAYYDGKLYNYIESRFFYCSYYAILAGAHPKFAELRALVESGVNVIILDIDGPSDVSHNIPLTLEYVKSEYTNPDHPFGHGLVVCCMLMGWTPWIK
jgi:hypothetical protein